MKRELYSTHSTWEDKIGYSRAVRVGNHIEVSGTTASDGKQVFHPGDPGGQTTVVIEKIQTSLAHFGANLEDVVRIRVFIKNIEDWRAVTEAYSKFFADIKPAMTLVESRFIDNDLLVEIEATAIMG